MEGKLDVDSLQQSLLSKLGKKNEGIVVSALIGIDACAYDFSQAQKIAQDFYQTSEECDTICKSDPITFPTPNPSKYAIIVNLNDLACLGAIGFGILITWLLPVDSNVKEVEKSQQQLHESALEFGLSILGGHTEFTSAVTRPVISLSMIGFTPKTFLPPRTLQPDDRLYLLGNIANEGTAILGHELSKISNVDVTLKEELKNLSKFENDLSIHSDALKLNKKYKPKMMHDPTEGGLLGAIYEMMMTQEVGVKVYSKKLSIAKLTRLICDLLQVDPLRLISSGTLLICSEKNIEPEGLELDHQLVEIGIVTKEKNLLLDDQLIGPPSADQIINGLKNLESLKN